jgi:uncharacterized protein (DUF1778 family)
MNKPLDHRKPPRSRKPQANKGMRTKRVEARLTPYVLKVIKRAAEMQGRSVSDFLVAAAEQAAEKALTDMQAIEVAIEYQEAFARAMLNPPKPGPIWRRARETHRRLVAKAE